jgi:predicted PurR-regulated permease PerM
MILFGTLGGIFMFGMVGIIIGPIITGLFVTVWEIYGMAFQDVLPEVKLFSQREEPEDSEEEKHTTSET